MKDLTDRQHEFLDFIVLFHVTNDRPPSYREISKHFNVSVKTAWDSIKVLEKKGFIKKNTIAEGIETKYVK